MTTIMNKPNILIVGAGAVGLAVGYHLNLSGADITFLVREGRKTTFNSPQQLYCYDDAKLKNFADFSVIEKVAEMADKQFQFVIITLDGNSSRTAEGTAMLRKLSDAVRTSKATVIMCGFGLGLREHYLQVMQISEDRLLRGILGMLCHQTNADLPILAPTDPAQVAKASVCYKHPANKVGFQIETNNKAAAKQFIEIYNRCEVSLCGQISPALVNIFSCASFPIYSACDIAGWPDFSTVVANKELWRLACRAQSEIMTLPRHGLMGKLMALFLGMRMTAKIHLKLEREMLPLGYQAFNRFHHGGKVRAQDLDAMRHCLADGQRHGRPMKALQELMKRLPEHKATSHATAG
ncbi:ketopantoate reductase family protein [Paenibacillus prosopidis]|uniref:Ketopantoate reductase PanE/ApbA-like protein n=1 Tax=Paenibacillus prosopidis TaxID=630520 RepID=A0A368VPL0_9BACL|nr:2-dehydropantoate 2-reductase N-terminal domain-containing protein [Paenibacillus prosopidis]RCW43460.1 ketopantoate reductase PanE/ApbA-like protein [Paenibacillus prosopidis]